MLQHTEFSTLGCFSFPNLTKLFSWKAFVNSKNFGYFQELEVLTINIEWKLLKVAGKVYHTKNNKKTFFNIQDLKIANNNRDPNLYYKFGFWDIYFQCTQGSKKNRPLNKFQVHSKLTIWPYDMFRILKIENESSGEMRKTRVMRMMGLLKKSNDNFLQCRQQLICQLNKTSPIFRLGCESLAKKCRFFLILLICKFHVFFSISDSHTLCE